jgi:hypothetical protein
LILAGSGAFGWFVECDAELDLDMPAGDADLLDEQAEQSLFLLEVEAVDAGADAAAKSWTRRRIWLLGQDSGKTCYTRRRSNPSL